MTQGDDRILETFADSDLILTPGVVAANVDYTRDYVNKRVRRLRDAGLVEKVDRGMYVITDRGRAYLAGELDAEALE